MQYKIEGERLIITIDAEEQAELRELKTEDDFGSDAKMCDFLEPLTCNSELDWVDASETGDMTSAPMLGIRDANEYELVTHRWAFMDYQVRSVLDDLLDNGEAVFIGE